MGKVDWGKPLENFAGEQRYFFARVYASGKVEMHDGSYSHADFAAELHDAGIHCLVSPTPDFKHGRLISYKENGEPGPAHHDTFFGKSIMGTLFRLRNKGRESTVEQVEDVAGDLWAIF